MNIFFDLDGTLIDSKPRLYYLFKELIPQCAFTFEAYWEMKKDKISHKEILTKHFFFSDKDYSAFEKEWMGNIEREEWLALDRPFDGIIDYLKELKDSHTLYVVTARQFEDTAKRQLFDNGLADIFAEIFVTSQKKEKHELIAHVINIQEEGWFVGDTGKDIQTGKQLNLKTAAVLSGFLNEEKLAEYHPDIIVNRVIDLQFI